MEKTKPSPPLDIEKELDAVVGRYEPHAGEKFFTRYGRALGRAVIAAVLAVAAMTLIMHTLDKHAREAHEKADRAAARRPIVVDILPAR